MTGPALEGELVPAARVPARRARPPAQRPPTVPADWAHDTDGPRGLLPAYVDQVDPDERVPPEVDEALRNAIPETTWDVLTYQWARFVRWCSHQGRDFGEHGKPPTIGTIRFYIWAHLTMTNKAGKLAGRRGRPYAPATVETALAAICTVLQWRGYASPWHHPGVQAQLRAYDQEWTGKMGHRPDKSEAFTLDEAVAMVRSRDKTTCAGLRDAAAIALHAATGMRPGELVALDIADITFVSPTQMRVYIRWSKTKQPREVWVQADTRYAPDTDAILLVNELLDLMSKRGFTAGRLFREIRSGTRRRDGTHSGVILAREWTRHGYEQAHAKAAKAAGVHVDGRGRPRRATPQGQRAGYVTRALDAGVPVENVAAVTGHSSAVVYQYYRSRERWDGHNPDAVVRARAAERRDAADGSAES